MDLRRRNPGSNLPAGKLSDHVLFYGSSMDIPCTLMAFFVHHRQPFKRSHVSLAKETTSRRLNVFTSVCAIVGKTFHLRPYSLHCGTMRQHRFSLSMQSSGAYFAPRSIQNVFRYRIPFKSLNLRGGALIFASGVSQSVPLCRFG
jgi:hypothetical protein